MEEKRVKDIMSPIEEYSTIDIEARLCDALTILRENYEKITEAVKGTYHKTLFVTDSSKKIVAKLTMFDLIRALVPESAKEPELSKGYYRSLDSRAREVVSEVAEFQERFKWLHSTFLDLVVQETQKKLKEVVSPVHPLLEEDDTINKAIYVMFKENVRQPLVTSPEGEIIGVVNFMDIFPVLLEIAGHECFLA
jgi:predicted transcriptional regulator